MKPRKNAVLDLLRRKREQDQQRRDYENFKSDFGNRGIKGMANMENKITDFLKTKRRKSELKIALEVLREFKKCESPNEWLFTPFAAWAKFEQLGEYLEHIVNGKPLKADTIRYIKS